jgi:hypothetical protein
MLVDFNLNETIATLQNIHKIELLKIKTLLMIFIYAVCLNTLIPHIYRRVMTWATQMRCHFS